MDVLRLRNLTTGILHTDISAVYQAIEYLTAEEGIMTHMLPRSMRALEPILRARNLDARFWDGKYDPSHVGEIDIAPLDHDELASFLKAYKEQQNPLEGKDVIAVMA